MTAIRDSMNTAADLINQAESVRAQLARLKGVLPDDAAAKAIKSSVDDLEARIADVESRLFNVTATGRGQDLLRTPSQLVEKLSHLADVVSLADFPPTDQQLEVHAKLTTDLAGARDRLQQIITTDVEAFNASLRQRGLGTIVFSKP